MQVSTDNSNWNTVKNITGNTSLTNDYTGLTATGRYVRIYGTARGSIYGYSIYELEVYGTAAGARIATTTTGAANISNEQLISVYPVPAHDQLTISLPEYGQQKSQIILSDINGKVYAVATASGSYAHYRQ